MSSGGSFQISWGGRSPGALGSQVHSSWLQSCLCSSVYMAVLQINSVRIVTCVLSNPFHRKSITKTSESGCRRRSCTLFVEGRKKWNNFCHNTLCHVTSQNKGLLSVAYSCGSDTVHQSVVVPLKPQRQKKWTLILGRHSCMGSTKPKGRMEQVQAGKLGR